VPAGRLLATYLNDHLAGATAGLELAKRARGSNEGTPLGDFLDRLAAEIEEDRRALRGMMADLEIGEDRLKVALGWVGEKVGRLKLNGQLTGYSPLSRLVELEGLLIGVSAKLRTWQNLRMLADGEPRLDAAALERLTERAERQVRELDEQRETVARAALGA
jgi:hypothetical protein